MKGIWFVAILFLLALLVLFAATGTIWNCERENELCILRRCVVRRNPDRWNEHLQEVR